MRDGGLEDCDQRLVLRGKPILARLIAQEMAHRVVKAEETLCEIALEQQRQVEQLSQKIVRLEVLKTAIHGPKPRNDHDGNVSILRKYAKLAETLALRLWTEGRG